MHVLSRPAEANTSLGNFIIEALSGSVIVLSAVMTLAAVAIVA
jgi:hypothetical protein